MLITLSIIFLIMLSYLLKTSYLYYIKINQIMTHSIKAHLISVEAVNKRHPHVANFKPAKYLLVSDNGEVASRDEYYEVNDITALLSVMELRVLLSEVTSHMPFVKPLEVLDSSKDINYEVMFNFCTYKPGDIVTETELLAKMNMVNKPVGGNKGMSYYKEKFPTMIGTDATSILRETNKPRRINFHA